MISGWYYSYLLASAVVGTHTSNGLAEGGNVCGSDPSWGWRENEEGSGSEKHNIRTTCVQKYHDYIEHYDSIAINSIPEESYDAFRDCCQVEWKSKCHTIESKPSVLQHPNILQSPRANFANGTAVAEAIENALSASDLIWLESIQKCVQSQICPHHQADCNHLLWNQGRGHKHYTYLRSILPMAAPSIAVQLKHMIHVVWAEAEWHNKLGLPDPRTLSWRRLQHVSYQGWGPLNVPHADEGSIYTISLSLSTPSIDFDGGIFFVHPSGGVRTTMSLPRGDALVFLSEQPHCATDMPERREGNTRSYLIGELWDNEDLGTANEEL